MLLNAKICDFLVYYTTVMANLKISEIRKQRKF